MEFEWDPRKAEANYRKHRVRFEEVVEAFFDPYAVEFLYDTYSGHEIRFRLLGISSKRFALSRLYRSRRGFVSYNHCAKGDRIRNEVLQ